MLHRITVIQIASEPPRQNVADPAEQSRNHTIPPVGVVCSGSDFGNFQCVPNDAQDFILNGSGKVFPGG